MGLKQVWGREETQLLVALRKVPLERKDEISDRYGTTLSGSQ
jgi:hypothetical protein